MLKHLKYVLYSIKTVKNWPIFLLNYIGLINSHNATYILRNKIKIKSMDELGASLVFLAIIRKDYGKITDNSTVVDIGANIGTFSIFAAFSAKNTKVYAYEPADETFTLLKENVETNHLENTIKLFKLGVSGRKETRQFYLSEKSVWHSFYQTDEKQSVREISCISMKDVFNDNNIKTIDVLKLDCEGAEYEILYNIPDEYFSRIKNIRMEYENKSKKNHNIISLIDFLEEKGFKVEFLNKVILWVTLLSAENFKKIKKIGNRITHNIN